jgi:hypothetical protein
MSVPAFETGFDLLVREAQWAITHEIEFYSWTRQEKIIRWIANRFDLSFQTAKDVFRDLINLDIVEPHYGRYRISYSRP